MIAAVATIAGVLGVIAVTLVYDRRRDTQLAHAVYRIRAFFSEPRQYRAATAEEAATEASLPIDGMRPLGALASGTEGTLKISPYLVDDTGTVVAVRRPDTLYLYSTTGASVFETERLSWGMPRLAPGVDRVTYRMNATDEQVLAAHRARIAKATEPLVVIRSIEQLAALHTELTHRNARWRAAQDPDELLDEDLRRMLRSAYDQHGHGIKLQLGRGLPRARVMRS